MQNNRMADEAILHAARRICIKEGIDGLSMRKLASRLGVTAPAIYRHYRNKQALVQALVDDANRVFSDYLGAALQDGEKGNLTSQLMAAYLDFAMDNPSLYDLLFHSKGRIDLDRLPDEQTSPNFRLLIDVIEQEMARGNLRQAPPVEVAISLWSMAHGLIGLYRNGRFGSNQRNFRSLYASNLARLFAGIGD